MSRYIITIMNKLIRWKNRSGVQLNVNKKIQLKFNCDGLMLRVHLTAVAVTRTGHIVLLRTITHDTITFDMN